MKFEKGNKMSKGRPKGTSNKDTLIVRKAFSMILENNLQQLQQDIDSLKPLDRVKMLLEMAQFTTPKLKSIDFKTDATIIKPVQIILNESRDKT